MRRWRGGTARSATRSTRGRSPTRTATGSAICRGSPRTSTTSSGSGSTRVWLSPTFPSPNADWGYDVADYHGVHPDLGTAADLDALIAAAARPWHRHPPRPRSEPHEHRAPVVRGRAVVARPPRTATGTCGPTRSPTAVPPNNWVSSFFGPAWTLDERNRPVVPAQLPARSRPISTGGTTTVRDEFDRILRYWFDRGVAGFRIDVAHMIVKDRELRDNPPAGPDDHVLAQLRGQVAVLQLEPARGARRAPALAALADAYDPPRLLVGETFVDRLEDVFPFYGDGRRARPGVQHPVPAGARSTGRRAARRGRGDGAARCPKGAPRCGRAATTTSRASRRAGRPGRPRAHAGARCSCCSRCAARRSSTTATSSACPTPTCRATGSLDPVSIRFAPVHNRDAARTPMPWTRQPGSRLHGAGRRAVAPVRRRRRVQRRRPTRRPASTLHFVRDLVALRRESPTCARRVRDRHVRHRRTSGRGVAATSCVVVLNLADDAGEPRRRHRGDPARAPTAPVTASTSTGTLRSSLEGASSRAGDIDGAIDWSMPVDGQAAWRVRRSRRGGRRRASVLTMRSSGHLGLRGAVAPVGLPVELPGRVRVRVDRDLAARLDDDLQQAHRRVEALGPRVDLDRLVEVRRGGEHQLGVEAPTRAGRARRPAGRCSGRGCRRAGSPAPATIRSVIGAALHAQLRVHARRRPRRAARAARPPGRGCRRRGCRPRCR